MRKKQLFAILLAGAMTAGTVPSAALAAENDIPAASSEVTEGENSGEIPQEEGGETTPEAEPTQTPETAPEAPTEDSCRTHRNTHSSGDTGRAYTGSGNRDNTGGSSFRSPGNSGK